MNNRLASALDALRDSRKRNDSWFVHYALGRTYLHADQFAQALQEIDWCFKHKGLAGDAFIADSTQLCVLRRSSTGSRGPRKGSVPPMRRRRTTASSQPCGRPPILPTRLRRTPRAG